MKYHDHESCKGVSISLDKKAPMSNAQFQYN